MRALHDRLADARRRSLPASPGHFRKVLISVLEDLWRLVVSKVVAKLEEMGIPKGSRIWWCPTSVLQSLPFHAAGEWRLDADRVKRYHTHDYISSYTPTLHALIQARSRSIFPARFESLLFVGQEDDSLQCMKQERSEIKIGEHDEHLVAEDATPDRVLERIKNHTWAHFSCHGELESGKPFDASFKLSKNARLSLLDIVRARLPIAELAFLAACHTDVDHT